MLATITWDQAVDLFHAGAVREVIVLHNGTTELTTPRGVYVVPRPADATAIQRALVEAPNAERIRVGEE